MAGEYNIKWRVKDEKELRRVARNFNDKLRRIKKANPEIESLLPHFYNEKTEEFETRLTIDTLKSMIQTRQDYNRQLNMLKRFSKRGAERIVEAPGNLYGTKTTAWQKQEVSRLAGIVNRKRKERLDRLNLVEMMNSSGKLGYTLGQMFGMGLASKNKLSPTKAFTPSQGQADLRFKFRALINEVRSRYHLDRDQLLKDNYIRTLEQNYKASDISEVVSAIRKMNPDLFILKFEAKGDAFEFAYPPDSEQYQSYLSELKGYWLDNSLLNITPAITTTILNQ